MKDKSCYRSSRTEKKCDSSCPAFLEKSLPFIISKNYTEDGEEHTLKINCIFIFSELVNMSSRSSLSETLEILARSGLYLRKS